MAKEILFPAGRIKTASADGMFADVSQIEGNGGKPLREELDEMVAAKDEGAEVGDLYPTLVNDALRKSEQTLSAAEKAQAKKNLGLDALENSVVKNMAMPFDRIEAVASPIGSESIPGTPDAIVYDTNSKRFVYQFGDRYVNNFINGDYYNETVNGPVRKDKVFICKGVVYVFDENRGLIKANQIEFSDAKQSAFIKELYLIGADQSKKYKIGAIARNNTTYLWSIIIQDEKNNIVAYLHQSPTEPQGIFEIPEYRVSGIHALMLADWEVIPDGSNNNYLLWLNENVYDLGKSPLIADRLLKDGIKDEINNTLITTSRVEDGAITMPKLSKEVHRNFALHLYKDINPNVEPFIQELYINDLPIGDITCKCKDNYAYIYTIKSDVFAKGYIGTYKNGDILPIKVYQSNNPEYPEGLIVAYVIISDVEGLKKTSTTKEFYNVNRTFCENIYNSPTIANYLLPKDGSITIQKLDENLRDLILNKENAYIALPNVINAVVGDTLQLYYKSIFRCVNPYIYDINVKCDVGDQFPRYYEVTPTLEQITEKGVVKPYKDYPITFRIKDNDNNVLAEKTVTLRIKQLVKSPQTNINILCCGASATVGGEWASEFKRRLTANDGTPKGSNLTNVTFVGRKNARSTHLEATGGYTFGSYILTGDPRYRFYFDKQHLPVSVNVGDVYSNNGNTFTIVEKNIPTEDGGGNISCSGTGAPLANGELKKVSGVGETSLTYASSAINGNPFVYNGKVDIQRYASDFCNGKIDYVCTELFGNGTGAYNSIEDTIARFANMMTFINQIRTVFPNCKFGIGLFWNPDEKGGMGINYHATGGWSYGYGIKYSNMVLCNELQKYITENNLSDYVFILNWLNEFDQENDFHQTEKDVNVRSTAKEIFGVNGVHPSIVGYNQMADTAWRLFVTKFCQ